MYLIESVWLAVDVTEPTVSGREKTYCVMRELTLLLSILYRRQTTLHLLTPGTVMQYWPMFTAIDREFLYP
jgi:hypothetical protein